MKTDKSEIVKLAQDLEALAQGPLGGSSLADIYDSIVKQANSNIDQGQIEAIISKMLKGIGGA